MSSAAMKLEVGIPIEERIARLESDTAWSKESVRRIEHKIDKRIEPGLGTLGQRIESVKDELNPKIDKLIQARRADRIWWLAIAAALLGVMARGFQWI